MPWNDNANPGPWGTPPPGDDGRKKAETPPPRPTGPRRPGPPSPPTGPDIEAMIKRLADRLGGWFTGPGGQGLRAPALGAIGALAVLAWILTGLYIVQANEEGVITRFGGYARSVGPGLHFHLPVPIEKAELVP